MRSFWSGFLFCVALAASLPAQDKPPASAPPPAIPASAAAGAPVQLEKVEVGARAETVYNAIDRKVYHVGRDLTSVTGSASDLLQNVPSVQVDVEGEVSLRGDANVLILVNGKSSALMGRNRAAALEQMSADRIARVEIVTNPSAKYKPDGTAGIINLVLKPQDDAGFAGTVRASVGNDERFNASLTANHGTGPWNFFGSASVRQEDRRRLGEERRENRGAAPTATERRSVGHTRPRSRLAEFGVDYRPGERTTLGATFTVSTREATQRSTQNNLLRNAAGVVTSDYDRLTTGPEGEQEFEAALRFQHEFPPDDRELEIEFSHETETGDQDSRYDHVHRVPVRVVAAERQEERERQEQTELSADYTHPLSGEAKLEAGYAGERVDSDLDFRASVFDAASGGWRLDPAISNRFVHRSTIHAFYGTYGRPIGRFGFQAGLRFEHAATTSDQRTVGIVGRNAYARLYPSLHLNYALTDEHELQLNYSHRVNRPDADELNPFPEFQDPLNLSVGNPDLVPEDIHSIEGGWQYRKDDTSYLASLYVRQRDHGITDVTTLLNGTTLLTRPENLSTSRSAGLELGATTRLKDRLALNFSANAYRNEIDARNLGFAGQRAAFAWDAKLGANWDIAKRTLVQLNLNYTARRLTPQGERHPTHGVNLGLRHNLANGKTSLVLTVSNLLDSMQDRTVLDTPAFRQDVTRRRAGRVVYVGLIHHFGKSARKKDDSLEFDDAP